jgi:hypothetical protein
MKIFVRDFEQIVDRGKLLYEYDGEGDPRPYMDCSDLSCLYKIIENIDYNFMNHNVINYIVIENTTDNDNNYALSLGNSKYYNRL